MSTSFRRFRFVRKAARAQWYVGPWIYFGLALSIPGILMLLGLQGSVVAWAVGLALMALLAWRMWQQRVHEAAFWAEKRKLAVWFEHGRLYVGSHDAPLPQSESLQDVTAVDVLVERGQAVRLLVDAKDGSRTIYAGFDDMEAFASEFRLAAPKARFRRVRLGFPSRLKEI